MTSDGGNSAASPLPGPDMTMKPGTALSPFTALPIPPSAPGPPDQSPWELPPQPPMPSASSPGNPLMLSPFPNPLLVTGDVVPGHSGAEAGKVIVKVQTEGGAAEPSHAQNFILTQTAHHWIASGAPCGVPEGPPPQFVIASHMKTLLPTEAVGVSQEGLPGLPAPAAAPAAQLAPIVPPEKVWPGPPGATREGGLAVAQSKPSLADLSYTSKGVYENFRRWQRYKALARKHLSQSPDAEALSCFLIPVLRSLARLKPTMTLEEGLPRAVQEWDRTSNFDRMIFYEMAEKFMEFEAEEEMQNNNTPLVNGSQGLPPAAPLNVDPPALPAPEVCQQPVYVPKKATSKSRTPRRRQRKTQRPPVPEAPKEIPPEAVKEYADIMEGLVGSHLATGESDGRPKEEEQPQEQEPQEEEGLYPDPDLLSYIEELCSQEDFVSKVEAIIHPQFLADILSPEVHWDPLTLMEKLEQEEGLSLAQLVQRRLLSLEEEEDAEAAPSCTGAQLDSSASVSDEDEDGGGRLRPLPGHRVAGGTVCLGKSASPGEQAREVHSGQEWALDGPRDMCRDGNTLTSPSSWDLPIELASPQGTQEFLGTEGRGPGKVANQISPHPGDHVGGVGSPGHFLVADGPSEDLSFCWQEDLQLEIDPCLEALLAEPELAPLQELGLPTGGVGVLHQGQELLAEPQEGCSGVMWGGDRSPLMLQSFDQSFSPRAAEDKDEFEVSFSPGLWFNSEMDEVGLELPLQIEVTENFQDDGEYVPEHQGGFQALDPRETTAPEALGSSPILCGGTDATAGLGKMNYSLALRPNENREQSPETIQDLSDLWAQDCLPFLEGSIDASALVSKEILLPACQGNVMILGTQDASTFPEASQEAGNRGSSISLLETTVDSNILDVGDGCGLPLGVSEDTGPLHFTYHPPGEGREDTDLLNSKDLAPFLGNQESYAHKTPKATSSQGLLRTSPRWGARRASVLKEASPVKGAGSPAGGAKGKEEEEEVEKEEEEEVEKEEEEEEEEEDEELSGFAYLLASKLSLSPRRPPLGPHPAPGLPSTGGQGLQRASCSLSAEARGPGQPPYPVAKSRKRALVAGPVPTGKRPYLGAELAVSGEKPLALPSQPCKRRRDGLGSGRRKKRRRCQ